MAGRYRAHFVAFPLVCSRLTCCEHIDPGGSVVEIGSVSCESWGSRMTYIVLVTPVFRVGSFLAQNKGQFCSVWSEFCGKKQGAVLFCVGRVLWPKTSVSSVLSGQFSGQKQGSKTRVSCVVC